MQIAEGLKLAIRFDNLFWLILSPTAANKSPVSAFEMLLLNLPDKNSSPKIGLHCVDSNLEMLTVTLSDFSYCHTCCHHRKPSIFKGLRGIAYALR